MISPEVLSNLLRGFFTCYWCGEIADKDHIAEHVDGCLRQKALWEQQLREQI